MRFSVTTFIAGIMTAFLLFMIHAPVLAQKAKSPKSIIDGMNVLKGKDMQEITYCDVVLPRISAQLQAEANKTCQTQESCVLCRERESNQRLYASMYIQPDPEVCKSVYVGNTTTEPSSDNARDIQPVETGDGFQAEVKQSSCRDGSTNLEVAIIGNILTCGSKASTYNFLWSVDGKKAGHERLINCVCGNEATVRITDGSTGRSVTKKISLQPCIKK